jgi:serine/threonine protein kinase
MHRLQHLGSSTGRRACSAFALHLLRTCQALQRAQFTEASHHQIQIGLLQNPPPSLATDAEPGKRAFSRDLHDLVARCLQKDKTARPTTKQLLEHRFFKYMPKDREHLRRRLLHNLPDVCTRVEHMRTGVAGTKCEDAKALDLECNTQYQKGVSQWNFDVQKLREQVCCCRVQGSPDASTKSMQSTAPLEFSRSITGLSGLVVRATNGRLVPGYV